MCMAAGLEPVSHVQVHGWLLVGGQKLSKTMAAEGARQLTDIAPVVLTNEFGVDPIRYYLLRETVARQRRRFLARGHHRALQHRPRQQPRQPRGAGDDDRRHQVRRRRPAPRDDAALRARGRDRGRRDARRRGTASRPRARSRRRGVSSGRPTRTSRQRAPWKMEPGDELDAVMGDALEAIRLVAILATPAMPGVCDEIWRASD